jgi:cytoskeletal protein CcmA (bactofilin family)
MMSTSQSSAPVSTEGAGRPGRLGAGIVLDGELTAGEDLIVDGRLTGALQAPDRTLTVGASGVIRGRVFAKTVGIEGAVQGEVTATGLIEIGERARVEADLNAPAVSIAQGAFVVGKVDMRRADAAARVAKYRIERADTKDGDKSAAGAAQA